jgi:trans-2,3-dihydro-3-hydroxyanthranilate isomerase
MEGRCYEHELCARVLGLSRADLMDAPPRLLSAGNPTIFVALKSRQAVDRAWLSADGCATLRGPEAAPMCVFVFTPVGEGAYSRMFAPDYGIPEDPATGSSTGPLARYMLRHGMVSGQAGSRFISEQGACMGRRSLLHVHLRGRNGTEGIDVGGCVTPLVEAMMTL